MLIDDVEPEEIDMSDVTEINDSVRTETGDSLTVNGLLLQLTHLVKLNPSVGKLHVLIASQRGGSQMREVFTLTYEALREAPISDDDYGVVLR